MFTYRPESKQDTCIKCVRDDDCAICRHESKNAFNMYSLLVKFTLLEMFSLKKIQCIQVLSSNIIARVENRDLLWCIIMSCVDCFLLAF